jgi:hypothetical protein
MKIMLHFITSKCTFPLLIFFKYFGHKTAHYILVPAVP